MPEETTPAEEPTATEPAPPTIEDEPAAAPSGGVPAADAEDEARTKGMPEYKGEPLDAERGPGLGCFWIQVALLTFFLVFTPLTVTWGWDSRISGVLLIITLILLLFSGQTVIFLLRLVAADRRTRRTPLDPSAKPTVGQMEDVTPPSGEPVTADAEPAQGTEPAPHSTPERATTIEPKNDG